MNNEPVAVFIPAPLRYDEWKRRFALHWVDGEPIGITHLYSEDLVRQLQAENEALKAFVKPIIAHGDDCIGNWDGDELQDLAVKTGLLIEVEKTQFCNLDKEEFIGCPCREYHYNEKSWVCLNTAKFLLDEAQK